jgi:maltokinase
MQEVDRHLLPAGAQATNRLMQLFELEKTLYELRYELDNRPDWLAVPVAAIRRLLEEQPA